MKRRNEKRETRNETKQKNCHLFPLISTLDSRLSVSRGFTIIEMLVAFGIFAVIMVIAVGSLLSLIEANHKAQALKTVVNNLHFALENMTRNIRTGNNYHCGGGSVAVAQDCPATPSNQLVFKARDGGYILYKLGESGDIERSKSNDPIALVIQEPLPITAPEIQVETLKFYVDGTEADDNEQPRVLIMARGSMQGKSKVISRFDIQTLVSQRDLDI